MGICPSKYLKHFKNKDEDLTGSTSPRRRSFNSSGDSKRQDKNSENSSDNAKKKKVFRERRRLSLANEAFDHSVLNFSESSSGVYCEDNDVKSSINLVERGSFILHEGLNEKQVTELLNSVAHTNPDDDSNPALTQNSRDNFGFTEIGTPHSTSFSDQEGSTVATKTHDHNKKFRDSLSTPSKKPQRSRRRRLSVHGNLPKNLQNTFESKNVTHKGDICKTSQLFKLGIAYSCRKGLKPESPNQDDFFIVRFDEWGCYAVFDGHGPSGARVSNFVQHEFPRILYASQHFYKNPKRALNESFVIMQNELIRQHEKLGFDCRISGTTATVVLHMPTRKKLYVASVGDSRAILGTRNTTIPLNVCKNHQNTTFDNNYKNNSSTMYEKCDGKYDEKYDEKYDGKYDGKYDHEKYNHEKYNHEKYNHENYNHENNAEKYDEKYNHENNDEKYCKYDGENSLNNQNLRLIAKSLTIDHKPELPDEYRRIIETGGEVKKNDDEIPFRIFVKGKPFPGLAMSRALGDTIATRAGVICIPDVMEYDIDVDNDICVLICSDGVWEFITNQEAADIVSDCGVLNAHRAVEMISDKAWHRWIEEEETVVDDITALLIYLDPAHTASLTKELHTLSK